MGDEGRTRKSPQLWSKHLGEELDRWKDDILYWPAWAEDMGRALPKVWGEAVPGRFEGKRLEVGLGSFFVIHLLGQL